MNMSWTGECIRCSQPFERNTKEALIDAYMPHYEASRSREWSSRLGVFFWTHLCNGLINVTENNIYRGIIGFESYRAEESFSESQAASAYGNKKRRRLIFVPLKYLAGPEAIFCLALA